jgi:AcrR family transcriptional regulator
MPRSSDATRNRILSAATKLFYGEGIRTVSVDAVAAGAGVTKRTLYYHFKSKDDLVAAYLEIRDQPNLDFFKKSFAEAEGGTPAKVEAIFRSLARSARHPKWKGCGFLRTSAELANMPGHPAIRIGAAHKKKVEDWLRGNFEADGVRHAAALARQVVLLLDGSFVAVLLHRDPSYMETAGAAASALTAAALADAARGGRRRAADSAAASK